MDFFANFWNVLLWSLWFFFIITIIMLLVRIYMDLFSDKSTSGFAKVLWVFVLIFFPLIGALIYLIVRGRGMAERQMAKAADAQAANEQYIREVATKSASPAEQIGHAKSLHDSGAISAEEFATLKAKALA